MQQYFIFGERLRHKTSTVVRHSINEEKSGKMQCVFLRLSKQLITVIRSVFFF